MKAVDLWFGNKGMANGPIAINFSSKKFKDSDIENHDSLKRLLAQIWKAHVQTPLSSRIRASKNFVKLLGTRSCTTGSTSFGELLVSSRNNSSFFFEFFHEIFGNLGDWKKDCYSESNSILFCWQSRGNPGGVANGSQRSTAVWRYPVWKISVSLCENEKKKPVTQTITFFINSQGINFHDVYLKKGINLSNNWVSRRKKY